MLAGDLLEVEIGVGEPHLDRLEDALEQRGAHARRAPQRARRRMIEQAGDQELGQAELDRAHLVRGDVADRAGDRAQHAAQHPRGAGLARQPAEPIGERRAEPLVDQRGGELDDQQVRVGREVEARGRLALAVDDVAILDVMLQAAARGMGDPVQHHGEPQAIALLAEVDREALRRGGEHEEIDAERAAERGELAVQRRADRAERDGAALQREPPRLVALLPGIGVGREAHACSRPGHRARFDAKLCVMPRRRQRADAAPGRHGNRRRSSASPRPSP